MEKIRELSTITDGSNLYKIMGAIKYFGEPRSTQFVEVHTGGWGGGSEIFLSYSTSNMCVNIMAQPCNGGAMKIVRGWEP